MAAIDKIYGTRDQWNQLYAFLIQSNPNLLKYLNKQPETSGPISNFPYEADCWLMKNCPLVFITDAINEQYNGDPNKKEF